MSKRTQSKGACIFCDREMTRGGLSKHLASCQRRQEMMAAANTQSGGDKQSLYHLLVHDAYDANYWLHLEVNGQATLTQIDRYLRAIWLECCGHLSQFSVGGWSGREIPMSRRIDRVFAPGVELTHIYDFGTSSETLVKFVDARKGKATTKHPMTLMARNLAPEVTCIECDQPAGWLCMECLYEDDIAGTLCDKHAESHPHRDYGKPVELYNSPRVAMCGYEGPAEPPY